jgi:hypothetical protein
MNEIKKNQLTGVLFDNVKITKTEEFMDMYASTDLPTFYWMRINGKFSIDDFTIAEDYRLLISEKAMSIMSFFNIKNASFEDYV